MSDAELVKAVLSGDRDRFVVLIERHERSVRAIAFSVVREHESARDVTQDVFVEAYRGLATLRKHDAFGSWVRTMARNRAIAYGRTRTRTVPLDGAADIVAPTGDGERDERCRQLIALAKSLPDHERVVLMLYYFDGHSVNQIASITGCKIGTVTMRLSRARARLRKWIEELDR